MLRFISPAKPIAQHRQCADALLEFLRGRRVVQGKPWIVIDVIEATLHRLHARHNIIDI